VSATPSGGKSGKPQPKVNVLRCRAPECRGLLAFEETDEGYLLGQAVELAVVDGSKRYLPCPKCGGRQLVEEYVHDGKRRTRVIGFEPV
jgi:DNA-directed RNA polymerase subunit RPC12/RpoP